MKVQQESYFLKTSKKYPKNTNPTISNTDNYINEYEYMKSYTCIWTAACEKLNRRKILAVISAT